MIINVDGNEETWDVCKLIPFTAETKSMTIIVSKDNKMFAFVKGADSSIVPMC